MANLQRPYEMATDKSIKNSGSVFAGTLLVFAILAFFGLVLLQYAANKSILSTISRLLAG